MDWQPPPPARKRPKRILARVSEDPRLLRHLDLRPLVSRAVREQIPVVLSH
jgi:hypothetical protein